MGSLKYPIATCSFNNENGFLIGVYCIILLYFRVMVHSVILFNPILHTAWLDNHALTLKRNAAKYYFGEKSSFLHTFLNICCESRQISAKLKDF